VDVISATRSYERWIARHITIVPQDLARKHLRMAESAFVFLRGTFYRWVQIWPTVCAPLVSAPSLPCVGDLHIENFGTWRDTEGRLIWGVNDVDEACVLPYTNDLVRLATSATLAARHERFALSVRDVCDAILDGYTTALGRGGTPLVLAERRRWLGRMALSRLRDPDIFWPKLDSLRAAWGDIPHETLRAALPERGLPYRVVRRVAGVGSLGRQRFVALTDWRGGRIAREAKAWLPSATVWATGRASAGVSGAALLRRAVRAPDPTYAMSNGWIVRRLAPDCSRIELEDLPRGRDEERLVRAMGWETANLHTGRKRVDILADLKGRPRRWLETSALAMADSVETEWRQWVKRA
jgi:Uncharacterized protein conserved in bacteria (DUF2252)